MSSPLSPAPRSLPLPLHLCLCAVLWLMAQCPASAQFELALQLDKTNFIDQEFMTAAVVITNRSGADVILGAPRGAKSWLTFDITDTQGRELPSMAFPPEELPIFRAGESITRRTKLISVYPEGALGTYAMKAVAYHPPTGRYYESARTRFVVSDAKPYKDPLTFGVPESYPEAGRTHSYELMTVREGERTTMYARVRDVQTSRTLVTYPLGPCTLTREPQYTMDRDNVMHVLFMAAPKYYIYAVVEPNGRLKTKSLIKELDTSRPQLFRTEAGGVVERGGEEVKPEDPAAPIKRPRSLSERPPGL